MVFIPTLENRRGPVDLYYILWRYLIAKKDVDLMGLEEFVVDRWHN